MMMKVGGGKLCALIAALLVHAEQEPVEVVVDLPGLVSFSPSIASIASPHHSHWTFGRSRSHGQLDGATHLFTLDNIIAGRESPAHPVVGDHSRARSRLAKERLSTVHASLEALRFRRGWPA